MYDDVLLNDLLGNYPRPKQFYFRRKRRPVVQLTKEGEFVKLWKGAQEAQSYGYIAGCIIGVCRGRAKSHAGFRWMYKEDYEQSIKSKENA